MYRNDVKTKRHFAEDFALSEFYLINYFLPKVLSWPAGSHIHTEEKEKTINQEVQTA